MVISRAENSQKRAGMLQDMHYRNISQRLVLLRRYVYNVIFDVVLDALVSELRKLQSTWRLLSFRHPTGTQRSSL